MIVHNIFKNVLLHYLYIKLYLIFRSHDNIYVICTCQFFKNLSKILFDEIDGYNLL